jgi:hypothetical protein
MRRESRADTGRRLRCGLPVRNARAKVEDPALGWCQALVESRISFEMVHDRLLGSAHLRQFKTLICRISLRCAVR